VQDGKGTHRTESIIKLEGKVLEIDRPIDTTGLERIVLQRTKGTIMHSNDQLITITQYSMTTARGMVLASTSFDSVEHALQLPSLCPRTHSIVIKNNKAGTGSVYDPDFSEHQDQLEQELRELFPDEFNKT